MIKRIFLTGVLILVVMGVLGGTGGYRAAAQGAGPQVDAAVQEALQGGGISDYVIVMAEQADLSAAYDITDWNERGWYVYDTLKETAARTQKRVIERLERQGLRYQTFLAGNEIYVYGGTGTSLNAVIDLNEVGRVRAPVMVSLEPAGTRFSRPFGPDQPAPAAQGELQAVTSWGLEDTRATDFWAEYGRKGEGIIVANIDSGVQYDHPALKNSYRCAGGNVGDIRCWKDVTDSPQPVPSDGNGHGTHTMGTMVGSDDPNLTYSVGMAPRAAWIACRAFATNQTTDGKLNDCADWILAPGGNPANRPHVINNSWSGDTADDNWFLTRVQAWAAAGIFPVFSAGNTGSSCSTIGSPGDYRESFTVAAHDSSRNIAAFSSRGPSYLGSTPFLKPNISAPGVNVISSVPANGYAAYQGTSMAAPHVAGAVALLWSCNPSLRGQITATFDLLQNYAGVSPAGSCGIFSEGGNYTFGHGYLDVFQAGASSCISWYKDFIPLISSLSTNPIIPPDPILNGSFEAGRVAWSEYSSNDYFIITTPAEEPDLQVHQGSWAAWLGGALNETSSISQLVPIPVGRSVLHYWFFSGSSDLSCGIDVFKIYVGGTNPFSEWQCENTDTNTWVHRTLDLAAYAGTTQEIKFYVSTDSLFNSNVFLDDISLETTTSLTGEASNVPPVREEIGEITRSNLTP